MTNHTNPDHCSHGAYDERTGRWECRCDLTTALTDLEARILRRVAAALRGGHRPGYSGMGGPADGPDIPDWFEAEDAARTLEQQAGELEA